MDQRWRATRGLYALGESESEKFGSRPARSTPLGSKSCEAVEEEYEYHKPLVVSYNDAEFRILHVSRIRYSIAMVEIM